MSGKLSRKTAIITGGGRGIGAATAELFVQEGARVVIASRSQTELEATAQRIAKKYGAAKILALPTDITNEGAVKTLFSKTKQEK